RLDDRPLDSILQIHVAPRGAGPERGRVIVTATDITARKHVETALRESERNYRLLFDRNLAGILICAPGGKVVACNDALARILGYGSREEVLTHSAWDFYYDPADRQRMLAELRQRGPLTNYE